MKETPESVNQTKLTGQTKPMDQTKPTSQTKPVKQTTTTKTTTKTWIIQRPRQNVDLVESSRCDATANNATRKSLQDIDKEIEIICKELKEFGSQPKFHSSHQEIGCNSSYTRKKWIEMTRSQSTPPEPPPPPQFIRLDTLRNPNTNHPTPGDPNTKPHIYAVTTVDDASYMSTRQETSPPTFVTSTPKMSTKTKMVNLKQGSSSHHSSPFAWGDNTHEVMAESQAIAAGKDGWGVNQGQPILTSEVESFLDDVDPEQNNQPIWSAEVKSHTWKPKLITFTKNKEKHSGGQEVITQNGTKENYDKQNLHTTGMAPLPRFKSEEGVFNEKKDTWKENDNMGTKRVIETENEIKAEVPIERLESNENGWNQGEFNEDTGTWITVENYKNDPTNQLGNQSPTEDTFQADSQFYAKPRRPIREYKTVDRASGIDYNFDMNPFSEGEEINAINAAPDEKLVEIRPRSRSKNPFMNKKDQDIDFKHMSDPGPNFEIFDDLNTEDYCFACDADTQTENPSKGGRCLIM